MKQIFSLLLVLCMCSSLMACSVIPGNTNPSTLPTNDTHTQQSTEATVPDPPAVKQLPMYSIALPITTQTEYAPDSTVLFNYTYQSIALIGPDQEIADTVIVDFLNRVDKTAASAETIKEYAKNDYQTAAAWNPYLYEIKYTPVRLDQSVLSLYGRNVTYSGTPHPETIFSSVNYDLTNGSILKLTDILVSDTSADALSNAVIEFLSKNKDAEALYEGFEDTVRDRFNKPLDNDQCWHLDSNGLTFYFSPYEIAPYASGAVSATIFYNDLVGIMKDAYFPVEQDNAMGTVHATDFSADISSDFTQFSEIVLVRDSKKFILYTDSSVQNLCLYTGSWSTTGSAFTADDQVFYASSLTPGDAIMVEADLNTEVPTIYLTYTSNGKTTDCHIMLDKQTGGVKLIES